MPGRSLPIIFLAASALLALSAGRAAEKPAAPAPAREFRAVWVATVDNIDWPSKPGLPVEQQKAELLAILDRTAEMRMNGVVFQVRPSCDALYASKLEPWSEFLTGKMGACPDPPYDPLEFAVEEAHRRGLELHAWFNPYRARHPAGKSEISDDHISRTRPELVRRYGKFLWLDPGDPDVQEYSLAVVRDVVRRYDVDGVHIDDYFYPYKEKDAAGKVVPFPDEPSWNRYVQSGGRLARDDWRRDCVDQFVERMYRSVKAEKKWVKVGISPFGIWRPGHPPTIKGFDAYAELYADARKWFQNGWVDYFTPQLYWKSSQTPQSYPVLLQWWGEQNKKQRHLWPGNYSGRVGDGSAAAWPPSEVVDQIRRTRQHAGATGNVHFSAKVFMRNREGLADLLRDGVYAQPAIPPASSWLDNDRPERPRLALDRETTTGEAQLTWKPQGDEAAWLWVLRLRSGERWTTEILPGWRDSAPVPAEGADLAAVSAVDRCGNESRVTTLTLQP